MPRKKKEEIEPIEPVQAIPALTREKVIPPVVKPAEEIPASKENPYYIKTLWHGVKEVWQCNTCGVFREQEDGMILHVCIHVPRLEQESLLNELMQEYKK